jgi:hypothetical protein
MDAETSVSIPIRYSLPRTAEDALGNKHVTSGALAERKTGSGTARQRQIGSSEFNIIASAEK